MSTVSLTIERTWDGQFAPRLEHVDLRLELEVGRLVAQFRAPFHGDSFPNAPVGPTDRLWEHEVVELFILGDAERYAEIEVGPGGHYLALALEGARRVVSRDVPTGVEVERQAHTWWARVSIDRAFLPPLPWRVNAFAMHGEGKQRRHLALYPPLGSSPDFHRLEVFRPLPLDAP